MNKERRFEMGKYDMFFIGFLVFLFVVFLLLLWLSPKLYKPKEDNLRHIYRQERRGTKAIQQLSPEEKANVVAFVEANFPDEVNEKILSETISVRNKIKKEKVKG